MADVQVRIVGVGIEQTLTVPAGSTLEATIGEAQDLADSTRELQARVNGEAVNAAEYVPNDGDTVVLVPPSVKLGA